MANLSSEEMYTLTTLPTPPHDISSTLTSERYRRTAMPDVRHVTIACYLITFVIGLMGNSLLIYVIAKFSKVREKSVANYYILNLAIADVLFILTLPLFCYATYSQDWIFGDVTCKLAYVMREVNKFASVFTLVALSVDRYLATHATWSHLRTLMVGKSICIMIWTLALIFTVPYWIFSKTLPSAQQKHSCRLHWPREHVLEFRQIWNYIQLCMGLVVPFLLICVAYVLMIKRLREVTRVHSRRKRNQQKAMNFNPTLQHEVRPHCPRVANGPNSSLIKTSRPLHQGSNVDRVRERMTRTVVVVVVIFLICHVPYYVMEQVALFIHQRKARNGVIPTKEEAKMFIYCNVIAQVLMFVNSCCNPVIYGLFNRNYRVLYLSTFNSWRGQRSEHRASITMTTRAGSG